MMQLGSVLTTICARRGAVLLLYISIAVIACGVTQAQSGRKSKKDSPSPTQQPAPSAESESQSRPTETKSATPRFHLVVVKRIPSTNLGFWTGRAYRSFVERLRESADVEVIEGKEMNRKEASTLAKSKEGEDTYVVWLEMEVDVNTGDEESARVTTINPGCLFIKYILFSPCSGKVKSQGKVYQDGYQSVCIGTPIRLSPFPTSGPRYPPPDYTISKAAREAADRILDAVIAPTRRLFAESLFD